MEFFPRILLQKFSLTKYEQMKLAVIVSHLKLFTNEQNTIAWIWWNHYNLFNFCFRANICGKFVVVAFSCLNSIILKAKKGTIKKGGGAKCVLIKLGQHYRFPIAQSRLTNRYKLDPSLLRYFDFDCDTSFDEFTKYHKIWEYAFQKLKQIKSK